MSDTSANSLSSAAGNIRGKVVALLVGIPSTVTLSNGRAWTSAIRKSPTMDRILLSGENFEGDYQANRKYHGGPDKVVCGYCAAHYPGWQRIYGSDFTFGAFGENITIEDLTEADLCIGDILQLGEAVVQVSQPRQPCANISKRWNAPKLPAQIQDTGKSGFYLRLIIPGTVGAGDTLTLLSRTNPQWDLLRCNRIMYSDKAEDTADIRTLREVALLSAEWKRILGRKLAPLKR